jgi:hypothetical protein
VKLLLTSAGIKNPSIHDALVELLGKPTAECDALCIPTALYGHPMAGPRQAWRCISGQEPGTPTVGLGWKSMGVPWNTMATAEEWAAGLSGPAYAIDDETAVKVVDGSVEIVSEGHWKLLTP